MCYGILWIIDVGVPALSKAQQYKQKKTTKLDLIVYE